MVKNTQTWSSFQELPGPMKSEALKYLKNAGYDAGDERKMMFHVNDKYGGINGAVYHKTLMDPGYD